MDVSFLPGYNEWQVFVDDHCVYSFYDVADGLPYPCQKDDVEYLVDDLITQMEEDISDWQTSMTRIERETLLVNLENLKNQMIESLYEEYGDAA